MKKESDNEKKDKMPNKLNYKSRLAIAGYVVASVLLLVGGVYGYQYASSPSNFRRPSFEHYHFRTQIVVDSQPVDFSREEFQEDTTAGSTSCSVSLSGTPIDFHDNEDQMTHIHWGGVTGGQFLKYYGWNLIGGNDDSLGTRYDMGMMNMHRVGIKGDVLPEIPQDANFYVYIGDENGYERKDWNDFLNMDLEEFFEKKSSITSGEASFNIMDLFTQKAYAHGAVEDDHEENGELDKATLERINNLIGNVVIFVQENEPSSEEIQQRFANLAPLHNSSCGG